MRQVVVIHGGGSFAAYEEYLQSLRDFPISLEVPKGWKPSLPETLGPEYQVILPRMPNAMNARYLEWKLWFEKYIPLLDEEVILVGHSLGGSFLVKYLSEERYPKRIKGTFIVASPLDGPVEGTYDFYVTHDLNLLAEQGGRIFIYQSEDDPLVPYAEFEKYKKALPSATARPFIDREHFLQEEFPEIVADIKSLN